MTPLRTLEHSGRGAGIRARTFTGAARRTAAPIDADRLQRCDRGPQRRRGIQRLSGRVVAGAAAVVVLANADPVLAAAVTVPFGSAPAPAQQSADYFPGPGEDWERLTSEQAGFDGDLLQQAIDFATENASQAPRDLMENHYRSAFAREPFGEAIGPFKVRGEHTGIILRNGRIVAEWGDPYRVDQTFSVTKSFVTATVGLAFDHGLITDVNAPVYRDMAPVFAVSPECVGAGDRARSTERPYPALPDPFEPFASEHARRITWDYLLRQTSDWEGLLWCKPDWSDRPSNNPSEWLTRERHEPGTVYEYNDVRVNLLALAALNVWRRPLPDVLRDALMDPIGASPTWRWYGYENSWVVIDGQTVQSVSGGAHWGGGMFINARDMARFGYLHLREGRWRDEQVLSREWLEMARSPGEANRGYGYMNFFLNTDRQALPAAREDAYYHVGAGANIIYVDPEHDVVAVLRWFNSGALAGFVERLLASVE